MRPTIPLPQQLLPNPWTNQPAPEIENFWPTNRCRSWRLPWAAVSFEENCCQNHQKKTRIYSSIWLWLPVSLPMNPVHPAHWRCIIIALLWAFLRSSSALKQLCPCSTASIQNNPWVDGIDPKPSVGWWFRKWIVVGADPYPPTSSDLIRPLPPTAEQSPPLPLHHLPVVDKPVVRQCSLRQLLSHSLLTYIEIDWYWEANCESYVSHMRLGLTTFSDVS